MPVHATEVLCPEIANPRRYGSLLLDRHLSAKERGVREEEARHIVAMPGMA